MARIYGLNGAMRGRQGNNVFSIQNGTQILKAYQPVVANPRTPAQQDQRARFALAGKISSFTPSVAFAGMRGASRRARRGDFVSGLVRAASVTGSANGRVASIPFADFLFSKGNLSDWATAVQLQVVMNTQGIIYVTIPPMVPVAGAPTNYHEQLIIGMFDSYGSPLDNILSFVRATSGNDTARFHLNVPAPAVVVAWKCPFVPSEEVASVMSGNVGVNDDSDAATLESANTMALDGARWGNTVLMGIINVQPA